MIMRKIIAVIGEPGTGKTTLFREIMNLHSWERVSVTPLLHAEYCAELNLYMLGKYTDEGTFAGTDRLGKRVQPEAEEWIRTTDKNVIYEGDRLSNGKFFNVLLAIPEVDLRVIALTTSESEKRARFALRGSDQSAVFLKSKATQIGNLTSNFEIREFLTEFKNETYADQKKILDHIESLFK